MVGDNNEVISIVKRSLFWPGKLKSRNVLSARLVSNIYDGSDLKRGDIIWSKYFEISCVLGSCRRRRWLCLGYKTYEFWV